MTPPTLTTERLILRPFATADAADVRRLAGTRAVADTTAAIPHPYPEGAAESWIATHEAGWASGRGVVFAITERADGALVGAVGMTIEPAHAQAELGYWIGQECWGRGYATEAARAVVGFGFEVLGLHRVQARHFTRNPASGRVMQKLGMRPEGVLRDASRRWDRFEDVALYAILAGEWAAR